MLIAVIAAWGAWLDGLFGCVLVVGVVACRLIARFRYYGWCSGVANWFCLVVDCVLLGLDAFVWCLRLVSVVVVIVAVLFCCLLCCFGFVMGLVCC